MYALTLTTKATTCRTCGASQPPGIIGWQVGKSSGALCDCCLVDKDPDLGGVLILLHLARELGAATGEAAREQMLYLHTACLLYEKKASWPRREYVQKELQAIIERMEKEHGKIDA